MLEKPPDSVKKFQKFKDNMHRCHGEIERFLYAAEQACPHKEALAKNIIPNCEEPCSFRRSPLSCTVPSLRRLIDNSREQS